MNENINAGKRREWIKNAAIVFLTIMLLLTFFSNTIMNYSLPEVATEYVQQGSITEKVRGTGTLEATDPYSVIIKESRKIESVAVKNGDTVEKGQILFYLEDVESEELKAAQKELESLRLAYLTGLFTGDISSEVITKVESGNVTTMASYQAQLADIDNRLQAAKNRLTAATDNQRNIQANLNNLTGQKNLQDAIVVDTTAEQQAVNAAGTAVSNAQAEVDRIQAEITAVEGKLTEAVTLLGNPATDEQGNISLEGGLKNHQDVKAAAESTLTQKQNDLAAAQQRLTEAEQKLAEANASADPERIATAQREYNEIRTFVYDPAVQAVSVAQDQVNVAAGELEKASQALASYQANKGLKESLVAALESAKSTLEHARSTQTAAQEALSNKEASGKNIGAQNSLSTQIAQASNSKTEADAQVESIQAELTKLEAEKSELIKSLTAQLNLTSQNTQIAQKEAEIAKMKEKSVGSTITAPVSGTIGSISLVAGETTAPEAAVAVIQPEGKGFTLSISATSAQAKKLSIGDVAEIQNAWYYEGVKAVLAAIKPDPNEPAQKKQLIFDIEGDVQAGQSLSISVGQKSADYELVVPNSAVREDKNGKFILIVESKSSPLGNRYIAERADVEVLASDDTHTAISSALYGYEYVITTSTKPVEAGKQVRLAE